jgi:hypothetical protein
MIPDLPPPLVAALADTPLVLALMWIVMLLRRDLATRAEMPPIVQAPPRSGQDDLAAFKLEVARTYVPLTLIRDLDHRLTQQLGRLEAKLDEVSRAATAAAAVSGHSLPARSIGFGLRAKDPEA